MLGRVVQSRQGRRLIARAGLHFPKGSAVGPGSGPGRLGGTGASGPGAAVGPGRDRAGGWAGTDRGAGPGWEPGPGPGLGHGCWASARSRVRDWAPAGPGMKGRAGCRTPVGPGGELPPLGLWAGWALGRQSLGTGEEERPCLGVRGNETAPPWGQGSRDSPAFRTGAVGYPCHG